jgi:hypothetical protein
VSGRDLCRINSTPDIRGEWLQRNSSLLSLTLILILGEDGIIRLRGRAGGAKLPYGEFDQPILPSYDEITTNIIRAFHISLKYIGTNYQLSFLSRYF